MSMFRFSLLNDLKSICIQEVRILLSEGGEGLHDFPLWSQTILSGLWGRHGPNESKEPPVQIETGYWKTVHVPGEYSAAVTYSGRRHMVNTALQ